MGASGCTEAIAGPDDAGRRLDRILRTLCAGAPLSWVYSALRKGLVTVNGKKASPSYRVAAGDRICLPAQGRSDGAVPDAAEIPPPGLPAFRDLLILANDHLIFLDKPRGALVHGPGSLETVVRAELAARCAASLAFVPGPLHRLDRNTSGLVAFPGSSQGARVFSALLRARRIRKRYLALLRGLPPREELWVDLIGRDGGRRVSEVLPSGAPAASRARKLLSAGGLTLAMVELGTGLTHQIRVQASSRGYPLAGDAKYGGGSFAGGYLLHAHSLEFDEPPFPDLPRVVVAPLPAEAAARLGRIFGRAELESAVEEAIEA